MNEAELDDIAERHGRAHVRLNAGRHAEAALIVASLTTQLEETDDEEERLALSEALVDLGMTLSARELDALAIDASETVIACGEDSDTPALRQWVALALHVKTGVLARLGREDEAREVHEEMLRDFGQDAIVAFALLARRFEGQADPQLRLQGAAAFMSLAGVLAELGRGEEARIVAGELVSRYDRYEHPMIRAIVAAAEELASRH